MRFDPDGPSIPDVLLERCDAGRVVFLCGAGVSLPSGMPTFIGLTKHVVDHFDPPADSEITAAFRPWLERQSAGNVPLDQIFNLLHLEYGKDEVNALVTERLRAPSATSEFGREHDLIRRISCSQNGVPQIVTTNFDRLFEVGKGGERLECYVPPAFPDLNFGSRIEGITYLHGRLVDADSESHPYVLSSADFGRAYLAEGWATNFIRNLLERYTVVMVGYQAEDPPIKYLLQGLSHDGQYDRSRLFAFDRGLPDEIEAKWRDRGVTAIGYSDHSHLWKSMAGWASRADDPRRWRSSTISQSVRDPKDLAPYERGQVAHVLRSVQGARAFAEADPPPHPEWLCVMDANVRSAKASSGYGDDAEVFNPVAAYGLDDDFGDISEDEHKQGLANDCLLVWRESDDSPQEHHRLGGRAVEGFEATPVRLGHLISWISRSVGSPAVAWWAIRQDGLHPRLLQQIEWQLDSSKALNQRARHIWNLIIEHHRDPRNRRWDGDWFDLKKKVGTEGWTASVLRQFREVSTPRLQIKPPFGLGQAKPPSAPWEDIRLRELGEYEVVFLERHNEELLVPDDALPQVFGILEQQLNVASGLLEDIETVYFQLPTFYPGREAEGREHVTRAAEPVLWFVGLFDRMASSWPDQAAAHATTWIANDRFYFRKIKLYALSKGNLFNADQVADQLLSLNQAAFWDTNVVRELLFLLSDRWHEFSEEQHRRLTDRILEGPEQPTHLSVEEFRGLRVEFACRYARYLELQGCCLPKEGGQRLEEMIRGIPGWHDARATSMVVERGSYARWVGTDEKPDAILDLPLSEVIPTAREGLERDFGSFTEKRPFTGLVKVNPRKALSALTLAAKSGDYPEAFWSSMINDLPADITPRLRRVFLNRIRRLPHTAVVELRHTLGRWLELNLVSLIDFDDSLGWAVYDHVTEQLVRRANPGRTANQEERSRRTFNRAINDAVGMCAEALFRAVPGEEQKRDSLVPPYIKVRLEPLLAAEGEESGHAASIVGSKLNWLMFVDPAWARERLIPMLEFEHPAAEATWNGFLQSGRAPLPELAASIKPLLLQIFPWISRTSWDRDLQVTAAQWVGFMRIFYSNENGGLSTVEMRSALRTMSDHARNRLIFWLGKVGQKNENGWVEHVIPLINQDWPRERRFRTAASVRAWVGMLDDTGDSFPIVYDAVKKFLIPIETNDHPFYRFTREDGDEGSLTAQFPESTLDLMNRTTPPVLTRRPYELPKVLALIAEAEPGLTSDPRYARLIDLVERS